MEQANTRTVVLQQPKDQNITLDLNHSTDTTAIWSFMAAMIIAFILGVSATIIAIWYGRKSFKLTELSFKTVSNDIKEAAELNRIVNKQIIEAQYKLKNLEQKNKFIQDWLSKFTLEVSSLDYEASDILRDMKVYCSKDYKECNSEIIREIRLGYSLVSKRIAKIKLGLKTNLLMTEDINSDLTNFVNRLAQITSDWTLEKNMTQEQWVDLVKLNQQIQDKLIRVLTNSINEIKAA